MMKLTNMKIGRRLAVGFGMSLLLTLAIAASGWWGIVSGNRAQDEAITFTDNAVRARTIANDLADIYLSIWHIATTKDAGAAKQEYKAALEKSRADYITKIAEAKEHANSDEIKQAITKIETSLVAARDVNNRVLSLAMQGHDDEAIALFTETGIKQYKIIDDSLDDFCQWEERLASEATKSADLVDARARMILAVIVLLVIGLSVTFSTLITRSISRPLAEGTAFLDRLSKGDVSKDMPAEMLARGDEIGDLGRSVQSLAESLRKLLREISHGVQTMASSATQLTAASSQTAQA